MIKKAYHYLYYRTYEGISKTNKNFPESNSASLLSITFFINVLSLYGLFDNNYFNKNIFLVFLGVGVIIAALNLWYLDTFKRKSIILEFKYLEIKLIYKYLADYYFYLSILILLIAAGVAM